MLKKFTVEQILNITEKYLFTNMSDVDELISWMMGERVFTVGQAYCQPECSSALRNMYPILNSVEIPNDEPLDERIEIMDSESERIRKEHGSDYFHVPQIKDVDE